MKPSPYHLPYNPKLVPRAQELRRNPTPAEAKLWSYLKTLNVRILRQRPIGNFIVNFYCPAALLVIEVDGGSHGGLAAEGYDLERTHILEGHGLNVVRFTNGEVFGDFERVCNEIWILTGVPNPSNPPREGGLTLQALGRRLLFHLSSFAFSLGAGSTLTNTKSSPPFLRGAGGIRPRRVAPRGLARAKKPSMLERDD